MVTSEVAVALKRPQVDDSSDVKGGQLAEPFRLGLVLGPP